MKRILILSVLLGTMSAVQCAPEQKKQQPQPKQPQVSAPARSATSHFASAAGKYAIAASQLVAAGATLWMAHSSYKDAAKETRLKVLAVFTAAVAGLTLPTAARAWLHSANESVKKGLAARNAK